MNKSEINYIQDEMNKLKNKVVERVKKLAVRKEEKLLSTDEMWEIFLRSIDQSILPLKTNLCMSDYSKRSFLSSYWDFSGYEYPADIDKQFLNDEIKFINDKIDDATRKCILDSQTFKFTEVFPALKKEFDEHYSIFE